MMTNAPQLLIVDDDEDIRDLLTAFFRLHGYSIFTASDGAGMFSLMQQEKFDLVVLDVMLPREDGFSLCRRLRTSSRIPVIMLTAMGDHTDRIVGLEIGADDYLGKPFNARELLANETRPAIIFSGWRLDLARRELRSSDNMLVPLSGGEFDLLLAFAENPQRVLTRDQLLDFGRGASHEAFDRSVDVQVSRLRRKLDLDPSIPSIIRTVRNGGYMFTSAVRKT